MLSKATKGLWAILKANAMFGLGMIVGSVIGTSTAILITMGYYGSYEALDMYRQAICGG